VKMSHQTRERLTQMMTLMQQQLQAWRQQET
jgi:hypothetical protein